ncbi:MAG: winged helix-turn-helix transcriptional regulator [Candidatus Nealsonbacteria bacterium]|nr:winged helix-turn-helix transcriptional regulator [Candidatus Nealsonbacteria bacterium]
MKTSDKIIRYIKEGGGVSPKQLSDYLEITPRAVFKHLRRLLADGKVSKIGTPPKVFYNFVEKVKDEKDYQISNSIKNLIEKRFIEIKPIGEIEEGWSAFANWCEKRGLDVLKSAEDYANIIKKYDAIRKDGLLDGMGKMKKTFSEVYLDYLFYLDFYSIERFGKTKLGKTLLYAKQSQNKMMIRGLAKEIKPNIKNLIKKYKIDAVGFIPPTVKREVQLMKELENGLDLQISKINITKIKTSVVVPQKTLSKLDDRIENAKATFIVGKKAFYKNVLLIDDAVGSGATFNEIASQIKKKGVASGKVIGIAITGSMKGFDVISEV